MRNSLTSANTASEFGNGTRLVDLRNAFAASGDAERGVQRRPMSSIRHHRAVAGTIRSSREDYWLVRRLTSGVADLWLGSPESAPESASTSGSDMQHGDPAVL